MRKLTIALLLIVGLASCKSKSAFNYSEAITKRDKIMETEGEKIQAKLQEHIAAYNYDSIAVIGERMEKLSQQQIDEIDALKVPDAKGAEEFKSESIKYFQYIKKIYGTFRKLGKAGTDEERQAASKEMQDLVADRTTVLSAVQAAQKKFADANGFKLENK